MKTKPATSDTTVRGRWHVFHVYNDSEKGLGLHAIEEIDDDRAERLQEATRIIVNHFASQNVVRAVFENRNEVLQSLVTMGTSYLNRAQDPESILEHASFDISRRFANTCSIFRSFLDHFDGYFVRKFGKDSTKHREWKRVLAAEYDASIAYRVVYVMRNYIQHYDMPPLSLSVAESAEEEGCTIRADVQVAPLLRDAYVRNKLSASSINCEHLSLLHLLNDWSECFTRILNFAESIRIQDALPAAQLIGSIRGALQIDNHGRLALSRVPEVKIRPTKLDLSLNWLPEQQAHSIIERARAT